MTVIVILLSKYSPGPPCLLLKFTEITYSFVLQVESDQLAGVDVLHFCSKCVFIKYFVLLAFLFAYTACSLDQDTAAEAIPQEVHSSTERVVDVPETSELYGNLLFIIETIGRDSEMGYTDVVYLTLDKEGQVKILEALSEEEVVAALSQARPKKVGCSGTNQINFAKCVGKLLEDYEGKCLRVSRQGRTYTGDDDCSIL